MSAFAAIWRRELAGYFATPLAAIFIVIFLALAGALTFYVGGFLGRGEADLEPFFAFHPWLYLLLVPAIAMRLWAEERRSGTIELLLTLPVTPAAAVLGKFLAAWCVLALALALTFPMWLTVAWLGRPDHGVIAASYLGSLLLAGGYLAIGTAASAMTKNQVVAFVLAAALCFLATAPGAPAVAVLAGTWAPPGLIEAAAGFSLLSHFGAVTRGVIDLRDLVFFVSLITLFLFVTVAVLDMRRAG